MRFVTVRRSTEQTTIVNVDQITYLSHDIYGTKIFFSSGDSIVCPEDIDDLAAMLFATSADPEHLLIEKVG
ncbi:MAG: hypothetical protein Q8R44_13820 [Novosphingobium sp.]|nr:hypothetical protein [Novosphingobium sp.]